MNTLKKISIQIEDDLIKSIGINSEWISFHTDDGDIITLEKHTLERGLACLEATKKLHCKTTKQNEVKKDTQTLGYMKAVKGSYTKNTQQNN